MIKDFLTSYKYRTHREELKLCTDGKEQDKLLEQTILLKYPDVIKSVPRLQRELEACKEQMDSRFILSRHAVPISKINYAGKSESDDFTSSVYKLSETNENTTLLE